MNGLLENLTINNMSHIHEVTAISNVRWISMQEADELLANYKNYKLKVHCVNCENTKVIVPIELFTHNKTIRRMCYCHKCMAKFTFCITK